MFRTIDNTIENYALTHEIYHQWDGRGLYLGEIQDR